MEYSEHQQITYAGWAYRTNDWGWVIYKDPQTGKWHTNSEAILIVEARVANGVAYESQRLFVVSAGEAMPKPKSLVVDDETQVLNYMVATLRQHGYEVHPATDAPTAIQTAGNYRVG